MDGSATDEVVIGLDVGTSWVKAAAFGLDGRPRHVADRALLTSASKGGRVEQDPHQILDAAARALAECVEGCAGATVAAVSVAAAMHGLLALDAAGAPLGPVLTWADGRATDEATALRTDDDGRRLHRLTGVPVHPMSPMVKLRWIGVHDAALERAAAHWVDVKAWVLGWLVGEPVTDRSSAAGTGLRTVRGDAWCDEALTVAGVAADRLPRVVATTATFRLAAGAARRVDLPPGTPVVAGAADGPCANVGCGALDPASIGLSIGTSAAVRAVVHEPGVDDDGALFCYPLDETSWVVGGALSNGGNVVGWLADHLAPDLDLDEVLALAATAPPGCDGLTMQPFLLPERAPSWDATRRASYAGLRAEHTRAHLARAALEGVGRQIGDVVACLEGFAGPADAVMATGGALRAPLWREIVVEALSRPIDVVDDVGGTALGAACLGLVGIGRAPDLVTARRSLTRGVATVEP